MARYGWGMILFAGWALFACSQDPKEPIEVGSVQVELRSDLVLPETPETQGLRGNQHNQADFVNPNTIQATRRMVISKQNPFRPDPDYQSVRRYEFLPALMENSKSKKKGQEGAGARPWTMADKHWVRAGKGFGVAAAAFTPHGGVQANDDSYYHPRVTFKPYIEPSEHLEPMAGSFKSKKPLIFHNRATGFGHELPAEDGQTRKSSDETRLILSPIPETQVYFSSQPRTKVTLTPSKNRLDLMNGNENLNRHRFDQRSAGPNSADAYGHNP